jgi:aspartate carbamoyltransferase catalytic subunit
MNEGVEIAPDVAAGTQSLIEEQVRNGVAVRMALLYLLAGLSGSSGPSGSSGASGSIE